MANRHQSRAIVLQSLFEWDFRQLPDTLISEVISRNATEYAPGTGDFSFMKTLGEEILRKRTDLDSIISQAAPDWPLEKISIVDRNVLRVGLCELLFADRKEVPAKVAINEAIELAKAYGGENSGKFVNGVLGAVYKEIGEPGKDEIGKRKVKIPDIPYEKMPIEKLGGAVVYAQDEDKNIYLALVHDIFGRWTLSKGHLEEKEDMKTGIARVIKEEMALPVDVEEEIGKNEYIASDPEKGKLRKQVVYHIAKSPFIDVKLQKSGGLDDARWFKLSDILELNFYDDVLPIVTNAINILIRK